ncbi:MAG: gliding motility-associated C-terminal domain-containing protein [Chitinophagaceae bacterium]|nr:gliding motility-associated C-terminal domain-containing protein [Chitinophagaceae bacterium]
MKFLLPIVCLLVSYDLLAQQQACPLNNDFSLGNLTHWHAYTGNNAGGNPASTIKPYDTAQGAPGGTIGVSSISEFNLPSTTGIQVITNNYTDYLGGFPTIPTINGYKYNYSVLLGSTAITRSNSSGIQGGYVRGISYTISVPTSTVAQPYTMTYAYAMVLENGTHNSNQQPLFSATLSVNHTVVQCASPKYYLPTKDNADPRGTGATLDTAAAKAQGIYLSAHPSPNANPNSNNPNAEHLMDVWAKGWTEVTFDLSPYRGQTVVLTFEADNCVPGGHFAYAYVALRNVCDGLAISGPVEACINSVLTYSIPALTGASYQWTVPSGWSIQSGVDSNILKVLVGPNPGQITAMETNSCAALRATLDVVTTLPTIAGFVSGNNEVCAGTNSSLLELNDYRGKVLGWQTSPDGVSWSPLSVTAPSYTAQNLQQTTNYRALLQNGQSCDIDTSSSALVIVDPQSVGGSLNPANMVFCMGQNKDALLTLKGYTGSVLNWQSSSDGLTWTDFTPVNNNPTYNVIGITSSTRFRTIVKSGVCPQDISSSSFINLLTAQFPVAQSSPADTPICYGAVAPLNSHITLGTTYAWNTTADLANPGDGVINALPYDIHALASPTTTTDYVLSIMNSGCPNPLRDTFHINVHQKIVVDAGHDTAVVFNQPLQLNASSNDSTANIYSWDPRTGLDNAFIPNPVAILGANIDSVRYVVKAATEEGCFGLASLLVKVFKTLPDIFVPNAFTPGGTANSLFRPIPVGIATFQYFRVYNRYGQLVYSTTVTGRGWDGRVNGKLQEPGTFVWVAQGISYQGRTISRKGTVVLVR